MRLVFPFAAIVGQEDMKTALLIAAVDQGVGGVLVFGDRGTGKSTAVRALAALLPKRNVVAGCAYNCVPEKMAGLCETCAPDTKAKGRAEAKLKAKQEPKLKQEPMPVVDLPLGATEDRITGALDIERALAGGEKKFEPGLLARAHGGFLYIDEVNLLEDHLVDLLLDVTASGENVVEREGFSLRHPARFVLVGSGNPEEGELRPQLLDRFGLCLEVKTPQDIESRIEVVRRRDAFERDRAAFIADWQKEEEKIRRGIKRAQTLLPDVDVPDDVMHKAVSLCMKLGSDGIRGEITLIRAARAAAALDGAKAVSDKHLRRNVLDEVDTGVRVNRALDEILPA